MVYFVDFRLEIVKDPRHSSFERLNIIELKTFAFEGLDFGRIKVNLFFGERIIIVAIDFDDKFVLGRGQVVSLHFFERVKANNGNSLRK